MKPDEIPNKATTWLLHKNVKDGMKCVLEKPPSKQVVRRTIQSAAEKNTKCVSLHPIYFNSVYIFLKKS